MRSILPLLLVLLLAAPGLAGDEGDAPARPIAIGDTAPAFGLTDLSGGAFDLAKARDLSEAEVLAHVLAAAKAVAGETEPTGATQLAALPGLTGNGGNLDAAKARALLQSAGTHFGLMPAEDVVEEIETLEDVAAWITESASAPIVLMCWSPMCPTSRRYEQRIQAIVREAGARFFPLASNSSRKERDEDARDYVTQNGLPYRVLLDRSQEACDLFGGKVTPHVFVLDGENRVAYAGSIDNDPRGETTSPEERQNWLADALEAIANDQPVDVLLTRAKG